MPEKEKDWLTNAYDYQPPQRGEIREGVLLELDKRGAVVDVGLKADGLVPQTDLERLDQEIQSDLEPGQEVTAQIVRPEDREGDLILSLSYAQKMQDWQTAQSLLEQNEIWRGTVAGHNRGGLLVKFGQLEVFVPRSHLWQKNEGRTRLKHYQDRELTLKFIEVDQEGNRLVASERQARKQQQQHTLEKLLDELEEGQTCRGVVRHLTNYGAFVDLGGADGLLHISELSWQQVEHPREVVQIGDEIEVYVVKLDPQRQRIGLSLKRLQPDPWNLVDTTYQIDQLVSGIVANVVDFGAFVTLELGVEGLIHISELADPPPRHPHDLLQTGDEVVVRILRIDPQRRRIGLSLKRVEAEEREAWLAQQTEETNSTETETVNGEPISTDQAAVLLATGLSVYP